MEPVELELNDMQNGPFEWLRLNWSARQLNGADCVALCADGVAHTGECIYGNLPDDLLATRELQQGNN